MGLVVDIERVFERLQRDPEPTGARYGDRSLICLDVASIALRMCWSFRLGRLE